MKNKNIILNKNENILHESKLSGIIILPCLLLLPIFTKKFFGPPIFKMILVAFIFLILLISCLLIKNNKYIVTNFRVIIKMGIFYIHFYERKISEIKNVKIEQSFLGRIFSYGKILIEDNNQNIKVINFITNPITFKNAILGFNIN